MAVSTTVPQIVLPDIYNAATTFLDRNVDEGRGDHVAIYYEDQRWTYRQVQTLAHRVGNALRSLGIEMEQRVALLLLDSPQFAAAFWGSIKLGAVPIPMNTSLRPADYVYILNDSRAKVLLIHAALWPQIASVRSQLQFVQSIVVVGRDKLDAGEEQADLLDFDQWIAGASEHLIAAETSKDDQAFWLYSSGSTGFPKGCVHLQHDMLVCTELYATPILNITERDITFSGAKLYFAYGLGNNLYFPFAVGASAVYFAGRPIGEDLFKVIDRYKPTIFYAVPTQYASMLAIPDAEKRFDCSSLRVCVSAGEPLPAELYRRWKERFGVDILDGIGSTEICHIFISNRQGQVRPGSSGTVVPGYEAKIADEHGQPVPQGEIGNLLIKGDSTCAFYWNKHEKTKQIIQGEWIQTGDKYYQDEDGYLWYAGRSDDMLKVGGQWVSPIEVEAALIMHPAVLEAAVVGHADSDGLIKPKAYVVLQQGHTASNALVDELKTFVKGKLAAFKYPRWIECLSELPKTATGKIQRYKLRELA
jgi:benzoate-CoA ligase family protein